jgi:hypothetical protein
MIVAVDGLSPEQIFPTGGPIDEEHQIGRLRTIRALERRLADRGDALLLHARRFGKTSVALAAIRRILEANPRALVAHVDLTAAGLSSAQALADALASRLEDGRGLILTRLQKAVAASGETLDDAAAAARAASEAGVEHADEIGALLAVLARASRAGASAPPTLDDVLSALIETAEQTGRLVVLFIDEIQEIGGWGDSDDAQRALAYFMRRHQGKVAVVVAGSDRSATEALFAEGKPMHWTFDPFEIPQIERDDWHPGLVDRFSLDSKGIAAAQIDQILAYSQNQPLVTSRVAKEALRQARLAGADEITWVHVDAAIAVDRAHPSS